MRKASAAGRVLPGLLSRNKALVTGSLNRQPCLLHGIPNDDQQDERIASHGVGKGAFGLTLSAAQDRIRSGR